MLYKDWYGYYDISEVSNLKYIYILFWVFKSCIKMPVDGQYNGNT